MQIERGNNLPRVKVSNQASIRRMIYYYGPITRAEIAERLGLTLPTITTNINSMIACGIIQEVESSGHMAGVMGRKANPVDIVIKSRFFLGIEIRREARFLCITDYRGTILSTDEDRTYCPGYEDCIGQAAAMIKKNLASPSLKKKNIAGIGVCLPGLVDSAEGCLKAHLQYNWHNRNIRRDLAELTGFVGPISVENDACARAYGVQLFQREVLRDVPSFAYLFVSDGISCPLILNNSSFLSSPVGPGELGYMIMDSKMPEDEWGSTGRLSSLSGERSILERCEALVKAGEAPILADMCGKSRPTIPQLLSAQEKGDEKVCEVISTAVFYLGLAIANIDNFVRPHTMFIDSRLCSNDKNREKFMDTIYKNSFRPTASATRFIFADYNAFNGARGAAAVAVQNDLGTYVE